MARKGGEWIRPGKAVFRRYEGEGGRNLGVVTRDFCEGTKETGPD